MKRGRVAGSILVAVIALLLNSFLLAQAPAPQEPKEIDLTWAVKIPMRDGVTLNGTVYKPKPQAEPLPVVFTFTPYISDTYHERAMYFARNGYVFVLVDVRGRGNSEGKFEPFVNEGRDGHDVVEWMARQPWSNAKVTMWGGSYAGFDQWSVLKEFPPHLSTIVPVASAHPGVDFPFQNNIFTSYATQWLTYTSGVTPQVSLFGEQSYWRQKFRERYMAHAAFRELDRIVGNPSPIFQKWLDHPIPGAYYDAMVPGAEQYKKMSVPILSITGHYDGDQPGAMEFYKRHMQYGTPVAKENHFLIIGPWDHAGTRTPRREVGGLRFGEASILDMNKLHREWYDWTMKGGTKPEFLKKRVAYYVVGPGAENWKYADSLETISNEKRVLYLHSTGGASDVFNSGALRGEIPGEQKPDTWTYDPLDTRPGELEKQPAQNYVLDQSTAMNLMGNGAVYHTAQFAEATEISGYIKLTAWIALDVPDTDFAAGLYEIQPDGTSVQLTAQLMRARYRESLRAEKMAKPGEINRYVFDKFKWFSRRIMKGSRLRLVIVCPNSIQIQKNYNSGGVVANETGKDARTARVTLYHDAKQPSALELPIVK